MEFLPKQVQAAISLAGLSETALADEIGMAKSQLSTILRGKVVPREETRRRIIRKLEDHGIEFIDQGGVRIKRDWIQVFEGGDGYKEFADDRYQTSLNSSQDFLTCISNPAELASGLPKELHEFQKARMKTVTNYKIRGLRPIENTTDLLNTNIIFRALPIIELPPAFYVYGNKYAVLRFEPEIRITVITDRNLAEQWRRHFEHLWSRAVDVRAKNV